MLGHAFALAERNSQRSLTPSSWLASAEGIGVGLAMPTLIRAAAAGLARHQASPGSAVVQMGRHIGSVIGVAMLVVVLVAAPTSLSLLRHNSIANPAAEPKPPNRKQQLPRLTSPLRSSGSRRTAAAVRHLWLTAFDNKHGNRNHDQRGSRT